MITSSFETIGESCEVGDGIHSTIPREDDGVLYLTCRNFKEGRVDTSKVYFISEENFAKHFKKNKKALICPQPGDLVFSIIGTIGEPYLVRGNDRFGISSSVAIVRPRMECIDPKFLYYWMCGSAFRSALFAIKGGVAQGYVSLEMIRSLPAPQIDLPTQRKIAGILAAYDDLIENNLRRIKILEEMAQSLYREWFVHFRFPGHESVKLVDSALGQIPKGWEVKKLDDLSVIKGGRQLEKEEIHELGEFPVYGGNGIQGYSVKATHLGFVIAFGRVGAYCGAIHWSYGGAWLNNNSSSVVPLKHDELILHHLLEFNFVNLRGGAAQPFISNTALAGIELITPAKEWADRFCKVAKPLRLERENLFSRNQTLRQTRDLLLPKLLNNDI